MGAINRGEGCIRLDDRLNRLTTQLWEFLKLLPGNVKIKQPVSVIPNAILIELNSLQNGVTIVRICSC